MLGLCIYLSPSTWMFVKWGKLTLIRPSGVSLICFLTLYLPSTARIYSFDVSVMLLATRRGEEKNNNHRVHLSCRYPSHYSHQCWICDVEQSPKKEFYGSVSAALNNKINTNWRLVQFTREPAGRLNTGDWSLTEPDVCRRTEVRSGLPLP